MPRQCKDGSYTLFNEDFGECYHSPVGAALEARKKFAKPCQIPFRCSKGHIKILDVCFGFGYNTAAALELVPPACRVKVIALENDKNIFSKGLTLPFPFENEELFRRWEKGWDEEKKSFVCTSEKNDWTFSLLIGDALERISEVEEDVDIVFFDPFSPKKDPLLWTKEFFSKIFSCCAQDAVLVTYSCARSARQAMIEAGFVVEDGPVVGRRGPATLAFKR